MAIKNFSLTDSDIAIIENKASQMGEASDSAALRVIIREWAKINQPAVVLPATVGEAATEGDQ